MYNIKAIQLPVLFLLLALSIQQKVCHCEQLPSDEVSVSTSENTQVSQLPPLPDFSFTVPLIYKQRFPPATVCSGTIVTDKFILTAAYPIVILPRHSYCALPGFPRLTNVTSEDIENSCIGYKNVILDSQWKADDDSLNLAIVDLVRPIRFSWYVSTGRMIFPDNPLNVKYDTADCTLAGWKYRSAISAPGFPLKQIATELASHKVSVSYDKNPYGSFIPIERINMCGAHIGMPIICECIIVGVLALRSMQGDFACTDIYSQSFVHLLHPRAQRFLNILDTFDISENEDEEWKKFITPSTTDLNRL